jgi:hypothetical protein
MTRNHTRLSALVVLLAWAALSAENYRAWGHSCQCVGVFLATW